MRSARPGDKIEGIGPRGKITTSATADWHLFMGDESALPAMFAMTEALPPGRPATLVLEISGEGDEQDWRPQPPSASPGCTVSARPLVTRRLWPPRRPRSSCRPAAATPTCSARRRSCPRCGRSWPGGGLGQDQMSPKAYWGRGRANASHGEPARDA